MSVREKRELLRQLSLTDRLEVLAAALEEGGFVREGAGEAAVQWLNTAAARGILAAAQLRAAADNLKSLAQIGGNALDTIGELLGRS